MLITNPKVHTQRSCVEADWLKTQGFKEARHFAIHFRLHEEWQQFITDYGFFAVESFEVNINYFPMVGS